MEVNGAETEIVVDVIFDEFDRVLGGHSARLHKATEFCFDAENALTGSGIHRLILRL